MNGIRDGSLILLVALIVLTWNNIQAHAAHMIDMSHPFQNNTIYWPGNKHFTLHEVWRGYNPVIDNWLLTHDFEASEHGGTHMDAPNHFVEGKWTVDEIPIERFIFPAVVIDITEKAKLDPDAEISVEDLLEWESKYGEIPYGAGVLMNSGWAKRWPDRETYLGNADSDTTRLHFPGFSLDAAIWLMDNRNIYCIGVDTPTPDVGKSSVIARYPVHIEILGHNVYILENINNVDKLPESGATVHALPMKITGGSGGPTRMIAFVDYPVPPNSGVNIAGSFIILIIAFFMTVIY